MDYSFRNSPAEDVVTVVLNTFAAVVKQGEKEAYVPYANIIAVRLSRFGKQQFRIYLYQDSLDPIVVTNRNYDSGGRLILQPEGYREFVQTLHQHLCGKSKATFTSGSSPVNMGLGAVALLVAGFGVSFFCHYMGMSFLNPYIGAMAVFALAAVATVTLSLGNFPRSYPPTKIPMQFLP